jgi:hypothetical protein
VNHILHHYRQSLLSLLSVWMMVMSAGVSVSHTHAAECAGHVHGRGWNVFSCPLAMPDHPSGSIESHRHFLLLGLEFPAESSPDQALSLAMQSDLFQAEHVDAVDTSDGSAGADLGLHFEPGLIHSMIPSLLQRPSAPPTAPAISFSAVACRAMTGVLRS